MGKSKIILLAVFSLIFFSSINAQNKMIDKKVVEELNLERYLGTWYEIARYDHSFERGLVGVTANYSMRKDGKIRVENSGFKETLDGKKSVAIGKAKIPNAEKPSKLKVSFFLFFYGDYYVLELDKDYKWAVIGSSSDNYLWILSRTPEMEIELYQQLLKGLTERGYDVSQLIKVKQTQN